MKSKPQGQLEGTLAGRVLKTRLAVIAANWLFQGTRYMIAYEIGLKLFLEAIFAFPLLYFLLDKVSVISAITISFITAHTINWIINGHFFVLMRYVNPIEKTEQDFASFIEKMTATALKWKSIDAVSIYGSYCRGNLHKYSDLDVRVLTRPGFHNTIKGAIFCFLQRADAFISIFPLDIYCIDKISSLNRMRVDERPVILFDHSGRLSDLYNQGME
jgi:predicted nucleotidyltransferase